MQCINKYKSSVSMFELFLNGETDWDGSSSDLGNSLEYLFLGDLARN